MTTWGLVATILAPTPDILRFAAYHLEQGAHRVYIYLDAELPDAFDILKAHPKIRVRTCDRAHWRRLGGKRPDKHQARQTMNATHAYNRRKEVDWLIHMDADEFLVPQAPISQVLENVAPDITSARVRPMELLGGSHNLFKGFIPANGKRQALVQEIYPTFGTHLKGGFLSHVAGKLFVRTGLSDITVKIHNTLQRDEILPNAPDLTQIDLAHCHAKSWEDWRATYVYRRDKGSYRAELKPATRPEQGGMTLHELFRWIEQDQGEPGLLAFYDEVIGDSPQMRARLTAHDLLKQADLDLETALLHHFPDAEV